MPISKVKEATFKITKTNADSPVTAADGDKLYIDSSSGAVTVNLPASPNVGSKVRLIDLASTFDTNNLTIGRNSEKIMGLSEDLTVSTENAAIGLVYSGSSQGWKLIEVL